MQWSLSAARATKSALRRACDSPLVYDISSAKHGDSRLAAHSCVKSTKSELNGKCLRFARSNKGLNFSVNGLLNTGGVHDGRCGPSKSLIPSVINGFNFTFKHETTMQPHLGFSHELFCTNTPQWGTHACVTATSVDRCHMTAPTAAVRSVGASLWA